MKAVIVSASPKAMDSASEIFARELQSCLGTQCESTLLKWNKAEIKQSDIELVAGCDTLTIVFPLYVDGIPSHLLRVLQQLERHFHEDTARRRTPKVYVILNCGFYEGSQNSLALEMMRHWCARCGLSWGMGVGIGGGPMLSVIKTPLGKGPKKSMGKAYKVLVNAVIACGSGEDQLISPGFPRRLYIIMAHLGWRLEAKQNGLKAKQLYTQEN